MRATHFALKYSVHTMFIKKVMLSTRPRWRDGVNNPFNKGETSAKDSTIYPKKLEK